MGQKRYTPEQIIGKLWQAEVRLAEGERVADLTLDKLILEEVLIYDCGRLREVVGGTISHGSAPLVLVLLTGSGQIPWVR
jgi:hypothetical protein